MSSILFVSEIWLSPTFFSTNCDVSESIRAFHEGQDVGLPELASPPLCRYDRWKSNPSNQNKLAGIYPRDPLIPTPGIYIVFVGCILSAWSKPLIMIDATVPISEGASTLCLRVRRIAFSALIHTTRETRTYAKNTKSYASYSPPSRAPKDDERRFKPITSPCECVESYHPGRYHPVHVGDFFKDGQYRVIRKLGEGSFSMVWLARDVM